MDHVSTEESRVSSHYANEIAVFIELLDGANDFSFKTQVYLKDTTAESTIQTACNISTIPYPSLKVS